MNAARCAVLVALSRLVGRGRCASALTVDGAGFLPISSRAASLSHAAREPCFPLRVGSSFACSLRSQRAIGARIFYYSSANVPARMPVATIGSVP